MPFTPTNFINNQEPPISAAQLNKLGSQYGQVVNDIITPGTAVNQSILNAVSDSTDPTFVKLLNGSVPFTQLPLAATILPESGIAPNSLRQTLVSVRGYDSRGDSGMQFLSGSNFDAAPYINGIISRGYDKVKLTGAYKVSSTINLLASLRWLDLENCQITYTGADDEGAVPAIQRRGSVAWVEDIGNMAAGSRSFTSSDVGSYTTGDIIKLGGDNTPTNAPTGNKYGWMRTVRAITPDTAPPVTIPPTKATGPGTITIDFPIPRKLDSAPHVFKYTLMPPIRISGDSNSSLYGVGYRAPIVDTEEYLMKFYYCDNVIIDGDWTIGKHSRSAIMLSDVFGGLFNANINEIWDQSSGYGVNLCGATRGFKILGRINRVRHAITTNTATNMTIPGPGGVVTSYGAIGEPELNWFETIATNTTNKALDTHRLGWANTIVPNVNGGFGGITVRADNTNILPGTITNVLASAITVQSVVEVAAKITGVVIDGVNDGDGLTATGPVEVNNLTVRNVNNTSYAAVSNAGPGTVIRGLTARNMKYGVRDYYGGMSISDYDADAGVEIPFNASQGKASSIRKIDGTNTPRGTRWYTAPATAWASGAFGAGFAFGTRVDLPAGTIDAMQITVVTGGAGANVRLALYELTIDGATRLIAEATRLAPVPPATDGVISSLDCSTAGTKTAVFASPILQFGGTYVVSVRTQGGTATYQRHTPVDLYAWNGSSAPLSGAQVSSSNTGLNDNTDFPNDYYSWSPTNQPIAVGVRVSSL